MDEREQRRWWSCRLLSLPEHPVKLEKAGCSSGVVGTICPQGASPSKSFFFSFFSLFSLAGSRKTLTGPASESPLNPRKQARSTGHQLPGNSPGWAVMVCRCCGVGSWRGAPPSLSPWAGFQPRALSSQEQGWSQRAVDQPKKGLYPQRIPFQKKPKHFYGTIFKA